MKKFSYEKTKIMRQQIVKDNCKHDSIFIPGTNDVLISVPHGVSQTHLGKHKVAEIGTIPLGKLVAEETNSSMIIKTKNNFDNANFDVNCPYRKRIIKAIKTQGIKYLLDMHGLASWRECDINLGVNFGNNIKKNPQLLDSLVEMLKKDFSVSIDVPFKASTNTISGYFAEYFDIWTVQVEVNCSITNKSSNIGRFNRLVEILSQWINSIGKQGN